MNMTLTYPEPAWGPGIVNFQVMTVNGHPLQGISAEEVVMLWGGKEVVRKVTARQELKDGKFALWFKLNLTEHGIYRSRKKKKNLLFRAVFEFNPAVGDMVTVCFHRLTRNGKRVIRDIPTNYVWIKQK